MDFLHIAIMGFFSSTLSLQGLFTLLWMIYAWEYPKRIEENSSPKLFANPSYSFTALVPARQETAVIAQTILSLCNINYPEEKMEVIIICRYDDEATISVVQQLLDSLQKNFLKLVVFYDEPINKPHALNVGLQFATKDSIAVFDAEDEPHPDIYNIINTILIRDNADVVQAGVQLMNYQKPWFALFNVLEYYAWFKSGLHFFARCGLVPLAGNTVFIKKSLLNTVHGWDEVCLTEDADIGIRLAGQKARIRVVYDGQHVTQEETPHTMFSFIRQRTRWNQGFLQIFWKGEWLRLPTLSQKILACYILLSPQLQTLTFFFIPFSIVMMVLLKVPVIIAMLSLLPFYLLLLEIIVVNILFYEFTAEYNYAYSFAKIPYVCGFYIIYQLLLTISSLRAYMRFLTQHTVWEKTKHINAHRTGKVFLQAL